ncbi:MAG: hypothetical protein ABSH11_09380 [Verrucomicrobiota bacterium]
MSGAESFDQAATTFAKSGLLELLLEAHNNQAGTGTGQQIDSHAWTVAELLEKVSTI